MPVELFATYYYDNNYKDNHVVTISITEPRVTVNIIKGNPILNH